MRLDYDATVYYAHAGQAEMIALDGMHRAMGELMYDVWGVNEDEAFVCAAEWNQLTKSIDVNGTKMPAAYAYDGIEPIVSRRSVFRRAPTAVSNGMFNVQSDLRWVNAENMEQVAFPTQSGGYYWDEFLPEAVDNSDAFETAMMINHGTTTC